MCDNQSCIDNINKLRGIFARYDCVVEDDMQINGRFSCQFLENLAKCPCTILHYCQHLWLKLRNEEEILKMTKTEDKKFICISFNKLNRISDPTSQHPMNEIFFDFNITHLSTEQEFIKFVIAVCKLASHENPVLNQNENKIMNLSPPAPHTIPIVYINHDLGKVFERFSFLYNQVTQKASREEGTFVNYPDVIGYMYVPSVYIRLESLDKLHSCSIDFSKIKTLTDLKELIRQLHDEDNFNISFLLNKVIPEFYSNSYVLGLATVAVCHKTILVERAVSMIELLIFRGELDPGFTTAESLQTIQVMLAESVVRLCQKQGGSVHIKATRTRCIKEDSVVKKLSTVIILLHFVNLQKFSASENWLDFETCNSELSKILSKCNANDDFKMFLKNLDTLFGKSSYRMNKTIQSVLNENSVDLLSRTTKDLWGKDLPITLATVFQCFKKLFPPGEATHSKIHEICVKVLKLIDSLSKQQSTYEVSLAHQALIFDPSPDILKSGDKLCLTGKFHVTPVIITVLKQTVAELTGEKLSPLHTSDCRQFKNMVDNEIRLNHKHIVRLFAYRSNTNVPQFAVREHHTTNLQYSLAYRNRRGIYYPEKTLLVYLLQTISALEYCHSKNIVHCNLTAASIYVAREDQIMLGEFTISVNLKANKDSVLGQDDLNSIPLRWSALETLQNKVVSKETDIAMAGNLMYEVLSHGALPYSHDNISDEEYASKAIYYHLQLHRETCFKEEYYQLMLKCTHYCPRKRPKVSELKSELQHFINTYGCDDVTCTTHIYPDFENDTLKTSVNFTKGIPSSKKGYVTPILPKLSKVINSTIHLFNLGQFILLQEIIQRDLSTKLIEKVQEGALDNVVPKVNLYCLEHDTFVFDIFLPASCSGDVLTLIESKDLCRTLESCTRLLISVAEMLLKVHQKQLVLGELRASNLFVDLTNGEIKVHPISLKYLDKGVAHLKGPEVAQIPTNSTEMDIYRFGILMRDIYNKIDELNDLENLYATIPYDDEQMLRETVRPNSCPEAVHCLMLRCLNESPQKRPWLDDII
ncbi:hypothetical protein Btru_064661, partial [Bulinus truncatus]